MKKNQPSSLVKRFANTILIIALGFTFLVFFSYLAQVALTRTPAPVSESMAAATTDKPAQPTATQPLQLSDIADYRSILLLEHSADMMVMYEEKVRAGEIDPGDQTQRQLYTLVFPMAIEAYNRASPYPGMESYWNNVIRAATAYDVVYPEIQQGKLVSTNDLFHMQSYRQFFLNYQAQLEAFLANKGITQEDFSNEKKDVDQAVANAYGSVSMPEMAP